MPHQRLEITKEDLQQAVELATKAMEEWDASPNQPLRGWSLSGVVWLALQVRNAKPKRPWRAPKAQQPYFFDGAEMLAAALLGCRARAQQGGGN